MPDNTYMFACPTVPTITASEMRFSISSGDIIPIFNWPINYVTCQEVTPPQYRLQWGMSTFGARLDEYKGLRLKLFGDTTFDYGFRSTRATGPLSSVENQRVGVASLTIDGKYQFQYWNDHAFPWWPIGDGGDQGDTAGISIAYGVGRQGFPLRNGWSFSQVRLSLRLASGIPDRASAAKMPDGTTVYTHVEFEDIDRGDINLNALFSNTNQQLLDVGLTVNSGAVRHAIQSDLVHKSMGIPEFAATNKLEFMIYLRLRGL